MTILIILQAATNQKGKISEVVHHLDPYGIGMAVIGMGVVFISLLLLYISFFNVSKALVYRTKKRLHKEGKAEDVVPKGGIDSGVNAAIALALYMYYQETHDKESAVLTISKTSRTYSPWSSKIYGLRHYPR